MSAAGTLTRECRIRRGRGFRVPDPEDARHVAPKAPHIGRALSQEAGPGFQHDRHRTAHRATHGDEDAVEVAPTPVAGAHPFAVDHRGDASQEDDLEHRSTLP